MSVRIQPQPFLRGVEGYTPGEQPGEAGVIKLNTNEFPYPPAPEVFEAIRREAGDLLRRYPSPRCDRLRERLAERHGVGADQIFVGNGSDEVLKLLIQAYGGPGRTTATLEPTYSLYETLVRISDGQYKAYSLNNLEGWNEALAARAWDLFLLCVPNPPVGTIFDIDKITSLSSEHALLVLDEAYIEFADRVEPAYEALKGPGIVRTRTFSKAFGLAGLRVGYAYGPTEVIAQLGRIADSYNVNRISQAAALAALDSEAYYAARLDEMRANRAWLAAELEGRGFSVRRGQGNFLFVEHDRAQAIYEGLKEAGILVRFFARPPLDRGLRISIGTREELGLLLEWVQGLI